MLPTKSSRQSKHRETFHRQTFPNNLKLKQCSYTEKEMKLKESKKKNQTLRCAPGCFWTKCNCVS